LSWDESKELELWYWSWRLSKKGGYRRMTSMKISLQSERHTANPRMYEICLELLRGLYAHRASEAIGQNFITSIALVVYIHRLYHSGK